MSARVRANLKSNLSHTDSVRLRLLLKICTDTISLPPHTLWFMLFPRCVGYLPIYVSHSYPLSHYQEARLSLFCKRHALSIEHSRKEASQLSTHLPMRPPSASTSFCKRCGNSRQRDVSLKAVPRRDARCTIKMGRLRRRYRGGTEAGRAMYDKNGTFEKHIARRYRGGTAARRALYDKNGTIKKAGPSTPFGL